MADNSNKQDLCTIFLVRHGETDWNQKKLIQGHTDTPLNEAGIKQARELRDKLSHIKFDAFFSSDLLRAKQTAEVSALKYKLAVQTTKVLRERRHGNYEGKSFTEFNNFLDRLEEIAKRDKTLYGKIYQQEGVETDEKMLQRLTTFLREVAVAHPGKTIFIATHGGVMRLLLSHLNGKKYRPGGITNTAYLKIESDGIDFFLKSTSGVREV